MTVWIIDVEEKNISTYKVEAETLEQAFTLAQRKYDRVDEPNNFTTTTELTGRMHV